MKELARFTKSRLRVVWLIITACALCDLFQTVANGNTQNTWINFIMKLIPLELHRLMNLDLETERRIDLDQYNTGIFMRDSYFKRR